MSQRSLVVLSILVILALSPSVVQSQGFPWYTIPLPIPNGFVDASTGNLHLEIPLGPIAKARDGEGIGTKLVYDSNNNGWYTESLNSHSGTSNYQTGSQACPPGYPNGSVNLVLNPSFQDSHGTWHTAANQNLYTKQVECYTTSGTPYGTGSDITSFNTGAADGSGYFFEVTNYNFVTVYSPDGWLVAGGPNSTQLPMDLNGNYGSQPNSSISTTGKYCPYSAPAPVPSTYSVTTTYKTSSGSSVSNTLTCSAENTSVLSGTTQNVYTSGFLSSITREDGSQYTFTYDTGTTGTHQGRLLSVTLPTGGTISINYAVTTIPIGFAYQSVSYAAFSGGTWTLSYSWNSSTDQITTTVLAPQRYDSASNSYLSDKTVFTSVAANTINLAAQYYAGASTLLRTVTTTYDSNGNFLPMTVTTALSDSGQTSSISYQYLNLMRNYPTQKQETDFSGNVIRTTVTHYTASIPYLRTSVNVYAGSNTRATPVSSTLYTYDEYSANYCKNSVPMLTNFTGAYGHDDSGHGISDNGTRGNVTTIQRLITGTTYATTHACYDTLGNVTQSVDANGNPTSYSYTDNWVDSYCIPSGTVVHGFATAITDALGHQTTHSYFSCGILTQSTKDQNDINASRSGTTYTYDELNRPLSINYPDGGQETYNYPSENTIDYSRLMTISPNSSFTSIATLDGFGRTIETQTSDLDCPATGYDRVDTTYDNFGRTLSVSNPYCSTSDPTYGLTTYAYDALARTTQVTNPDSTTALTSYLGSATQSQDEGNGAQRVTRVSQTDALGRLSSVCEISSSTLPGQNGTAGPCGQVISGSGFLTTYQYDVLNNLSQVNQGTVTPRGFTYDSLSRLLTASNPESGTINYSYDANGNLTSKTDARGITTCYGTWTGTSCNASAGYDALNRNLTKSYSDGTPTVTFVYDASTVSPRSGYQASTTNPVGRMVMALTDYACSWVINSRFDPLGRVTQRDVGQPPCSFLNTLQMNYTYDLMGNETSRGYYNTVSSYYNNAGRLTSFVGTAYLGNTSFLTGAHYNALGEITSDTLSDGETETWTYNDKRGRITAYSAVNGSTPIYSYSLTYAPNSDIATANDSVNGNWNYQYDQFNRLICSNLASNGTCASPTSGTATYAYDYDRFGNRWDQTGPVSFHATFTGNNPGSPANTNRIDGYTYDAAGNLTFDKVHYYYYDAENRLTQIDGNPGYCATLASGGTPTGALPTTCNMYDALGRRVQHIDNTVSPSDCSPNTGSVWYDYDLQDRPYFLTNNYSSGQCHYEFYAGNRHLVTYTSTFEFDHSDWLGTERVRATSATNIETCTSLPFGDNLHCSNAGDQYAYSTLHFTGKERDVESSLDNFGARFLTSSMGRFMSPDPENAGADSDNPQSWNAYSYALNNPLRYVDPSGLACLDAGGNVVVNEDGGETYVNREDCENANYLWIDPAPAQTVTVTADPMPDTNSTVQWIGDFVDSWNRVDLTKLAVKLNRCAASKTDKLYGKVLGEGKIKNALLGNAVAGASQLILGPDRASGAKDVTGDAALHVAPQVAGQTVGAIPTLRGTAIYAVPGTEIELGGQPRVATMVERYTATRLKDAAAFKTATSVGEDVLDGKLIADALVYLGSEVACAVQ